MSFALLLTALSDGKPRHVTELAQIVQTTPAQLNGLWQQAPQHLHGLLRQNDGYWKLAKSIALLPENTRHPLFDVQVQPETFAKPTPNTPTAEFTAHLAVGVLGGKGFRLKTKMERRRLIAKWRIQ